MDSMFGGNIAALWKVASQMDGVRLKSQSLFRQDIRHQKVNRSAGSVSFNGNRSSFGDRDGIVEKPPISYVALITVAIKHSIEGRLTLAEIYDYLIRNFKYFRTTRSRGWMNAVRHNLTLNDCFVKLPRDSMMRGKGSYWCIDPASKGMFNHGSLKRRRTRYKRSRTEIEVVKDILSHNCATSFSHVCRPPLELHRVSPQCGRKSSVPVISSETVPKKKFSNFSIDAILGNESTKSFPTAKQVFQFYSTEVWQC